MTYRTITVIIASLTVILFLGCGSDRDTSSTSPGSVIKEEATAQDETTGTQNTSKQQAPKDTSTPAGTEPEKKVESHSPATPRFSGDIEYSYQFTAGAASPQAVMIGVINALKTDNLTAYASLVPNSDIYLKKSIDEQKALLASGTPAQQEQANTMLTNYSKPESLATFKSQRDSHAQTHAAKFNSLKGIVGKYSDLPNLSVGAADITTKLNSHTGQTMCTINTEKDGQPYSITLFTEQYNGKWYYSGNYFAGN